VGWLTLIKALRRARGSIATDDQDLLSVYESTFAVIFFGTPHRGSPCSSIGVSAARTAKLAGFSVHESFAAILDDRQIHVTTFQEGEGFARCVLLDGKGKLKNGRLQNVRPSKVFKL
jgi:hypothetical protein